MYLHAYDNDLNYLGTKEVDRATIQVQKDFEKELLLKYPNVTVNFDVEPTNKELYEQEENDDLLFSRHIPTM
ncbi:MAG: hypothetical protein GW823_06610 [Bacteroidetes bacterium]|nr:hypothetical protein [Bacteroidota bacterium]